MNNQEISRAVAAVEFPPNTVRHRGSNLVLHISALKLFAEFGQKVGRGMGAKEFGF